LTTFEALSVLPAEWRGRLAKHELVAVTSGMSGADVFRVRDAATGDQYLKIDIGPDSEHLRGEAERTKWLAAVGVRVPEVTMQFAGVDAFAFMMAALSGQPAEHTSTDHWRPVVGAIAQAFAALHALPVDSCPFDETLNVRLARARDLVRRGAIDVTQFDARNIGFAPEALYQRLETSIPAHEDCVVVHGDATLSNLIVADDGKIGFIDCGSCGKADRYTDLALLAGEIADRFGVEARSAFLAAYGAAQWDERKAEFYRDLYEFF
jgi:aminoglycoside 3'-phosphotransferase-2